MRRRSGFTLVEVVLAMSILLIVMMALVTMTGRTLRVATTSDREQAAVQLVTDRTDEVRTDPDYGGLDTLYAGTESSFPTLPGFVRTTTIVRTTANNNDFKTITVRVTGPGLGAGVARTVTVAAP
jgi:prepilin-type N-terminal cleavage/methylation domain-containing protein